MNEQVLAGLRVLVVEDELWLAMLLEDMLGELECKVVGPVARIAAAREMARKGEFDCAILDVNLAGTPVYSVAEILAERHIPFMLASGYSSSEIDERFRERLMLHKPFRANELRDCLAALAHRDGGGKPAHPAA